MTKTNNPSARIYETPFMEIQVFKGFRQTTVLALFKIREDKWTCVNLSRSDAAYVLRNARKNS